MTLVSHLLDRRSRSQAPVPLHTRRLFPISLREPSRASVTFGRRTAPVKLPTSQCPRPDHGTRLDTKTQQGGYFTLPPPELAPASQAPTILHIKS